MDNTTALTPDIGNITIQGSTVQAGKTLSLDAQNKINILSSQDTSKERSSEESSSGSVGIGASLGAGGGGVGFTASASRSQGQGNGDSVTQNNSQLQGQTVTLKSGSDTVIQGGVIKADTVKADIGGNLTITSVQDTDTYHADSQNVSASVTIGAGASGSVGLGKSRTNSDYASVTEQSGIKTGDGGFDLKIAGSTTLTGGVISTTDAGIKAGNNKIATTEIKTSDIQNSASYDSQSWQLNIGSSAGASSAGYGSASGNASSTTQAGISGIAGNTAARTGDKETGIAKIFNQVQVKEDVDAQVTITTEAGRQIPKATATFADKQRADLIEKAKAAAEKGDKSTAIAYEQEAAKWEEGGSYRTAIHTAFGALSGGVGGAVGAGVVAANADTLNQMQDSFTQTLKDAGVNENVAKAIGNVTFNTAAIGIGSAVGGATGATTALNVDSNNRQLHPSEVAFLADKARIKRYIEYKRSLGVNLSEADAAKALDRYGAAMVDGQWQKVNGSDPATENFIRSEVAKSSVFYIGEDGKAHTFFTATADEYNNELINLRTLIETGIKDPIVSNYLDNQVDHKRDAGAQERYNAGFKLGESDAKKESSFGNDVKNGLIAPWTVIKYIYNSATSDKVGIIDDAHEIAAYNTLLGIQGRQDESGYIAGRKWEDLTRTAPINAVTAQITGALIGAGIRSAVGGIKVAGTADVLDSEGNVIGKTTVKPVKGDSSSTANGNSVAAGGASTIKPSWPVQNVEPLPSFIQSGETTCGQTCAAAMAVSMGYTDVSEQTLNQALGTGEQSAESLSGALKNITGGKSLGGTVQFDPAKLSPSEMQSFINGQTGYGTRPVMVLLNAPNASITASGHWVIANGVDNFGNIIIKDPAGLQYTMTPANFANSWKSGAIVTLRK